MANSTIDYSSDYSDEDIVVHPMSQSDEEQENQQNGDYSEEYSDEENPFMPTPQKPTNMDDDNDYSDDDADMVEVDTNKKPANKPKDKQKKPTIKTVKNYEHIETEAKAPTKNDFINSPAYKAIEWMLSNIHKTPKTGGLSKAPIKIFGEKLTKSEIETFYNLFAAAYPIKHAIRGLLKMKDKEPKYSMGKIDEFKDEKVIIIKTKIMATSSSKKQDIYYCNPEETNNIIAYDKFIHDLSININKNGLTFDKLLSFLSLDIWNTKYICEYKDTIRLSLLDFPDFGFNFNDDFDYDNAKNVNSVEEYIGLFNKKTINDPYEIYKRRRGIVDKSEDILTDSFIDKAFEQTIKGLNKKGPELEKILYKLLSKKPIKDIFMKGIEANKFIERCFAVIFKHKDFKKLIISKLYNISFLFSPYMFKNEAMEEDYGKGAKKSIIMKAKTNNARKDKIIKEFILNVQDNCNKDKNYWLGFIGAPMEENYWIAEKPTEEKKIEKQTEKPKAEKKAEKEDSDYSDEEDEPLFVPKSKHSDKASTSSKSSRSSKTSSASKKSEKKKSNK